MSGFKETITTFYNNNRVEELLSTAESEISQGRIENGLCALTAVLNLSVRQENFSNIPRMRILFDRAKRVQDDKARDALFGFRSAYTLEKDYNTLRKESAKKSRKEYLNRPEVKAKMTAFKQAMKVKRKELYQKMKRNRDVEITVDVVDDTEF